MRVLYVEDDRINSLLFRETCRLAPAVVLEIADCGAEAMALAATWQPQVLVLDLHLPDTNGMALLPALRALPGLADVPAFLCTADDTAPLAPAAQEAGFSGCWPKPVALPSLLAALAQLRPASGA